MKLYGIRNCDTVKKATKWLESNGIDFEFMDLKKIELSPVEINRWLELHGLDKVINKRSTTWKALDSDAKEALSIDNAAALIKANPTLIKRPLIDQGKSIHTGFKEAEFQTLFG